MKIIVGLGNPGKQYERTRHNVGFMILDALRNQYAETLSDWTLSKKFNALIATGIIERTPVILAKPMTFMNVSGQSVQLLLNFYKTTSQDLTVVNDDKDLPLGIIKVQPDRGHAGHNGVRSIIEHIGTQQFLRVRVGIATEQKRKMEDVSAFVLSKFSLTERGRLKVMLPEAVEALVRSL